MTRPYLHPNGFIHMNLTPRKRLHIWADGIPQAQKVHTPIHDHTFYFSSRIIHGVIQHTTYYANPRSEREATHCFYEVNTKKEILEPTKYWCEPTIAATELFRAGDSYTFGGRGRFHDSRGFGGGTTVTIMTVEQKEFGSRPARVLVPKGVEPDNDFQRDQYSADTLWPFVEDALKHMTMNDWKWVYTDA